MTMAAIQAKKHSYVEKPLAHTIEEGAALVKASEASVWFAGGDAEPQQQAVPTAKEMYERATSPDPLRARVLVPNFLPRPVPAPWRYVIPAMRAPRIPIGPLLGPRRNGLDKHRYFQWRNYWIIGRISTDLLVHQTDISNYVWARPFRWPAWPRRIYMWDARRPRGTGHLSAIYEYPTGSI